MEYMVSCSEVNGVITANPDILVVNPGDTIRWNNQLSEDYRATNFSPQVPPLFGNTVIEIPTGVSLPAMVAAKPNRGESFEYHYSLVPVNAGESAVDPVIVVQGPGDPTQG